jgi:hypothetical protein
MKSKVAEADYFLRGIIYQIKERNAQNPDEGMNYFQFQFRVVDARNGLIVWEKMLDSKMEGEYQPLQGIGAGAGAIVPPGTPDPNQAGGQQPWPPVDPNQQGQQNQQGVVPQNLTPQGGDGTSGLMGIPIPQSGTNALKRMIKDVGKSLIK